MTTKLKGLSARAGRHLAFAALPLLALAARSAHADGDYFSPTDDHVRISLGATYVSSTTNFRADPNTGFPGTQLNAENDFGLDKSEVEPKFQVMLRLGTRQRLSFDYFTLDRSGNTRVGTNPIIFRNVVFIPGDPLQTQMNLRTLGVTYGYSFWHSETLEIAATVGVHSTDISTMAKVQTATRHIIQTEDEAGFVPTAGFDATWVASKRFYVDARAQYLDVHVSNLSGSLGLYEVDGLYRFRPNVSFGLGYAAIVAHLDSTRSSQTGLFDFNSKGPEAFVRVAF